MAISGLALRNDFGLHGSIDNISEGYKPIALNELYRREKTAYIGLWSNTERTEKRRLGSRLSKVDDDPAS